ncbi:MAG: transglycosylase SLT domain-containing protein [Nitrospirae bacterium]|nr:transglycosylase SLT domain-containing protein [Nitrospirota bacterium]
MIFRKTFTVLSILFLGLAWGCATHKTALISPASLASPSSENQVQKPDQAKNPPLMSENAPLIPENPFIPAPVPLLSSPSGDSPSQINQELPPLEETDVEEDTDEKDSEEPVYDIPIVKNQTVENYISYYQNRNRPHFEIWLSRSGRYLPVMKEVFKSFDLPEDLVFLALIESGFNPHAYSRSKAAGAWQFMKPTAKKYGLRVDRWIDERRDPIKSTYAAAKYLKDLYSIFGSWPLALASYNAGEGKVMRAMAKTKAEDFWDLSSTRYLRPETKNYVPQFMAATIIAKNPEKYGFSLEYLEPLKFDTVLIDRPTDLRVLARVVHASYETIKELNPELRKGMTPPLYPNYPLRIPEGTKSLFDENFKKVSEVTKVLKQKHRVKRGETLLSISKRFGVPLQDLADSNSLGPTDKLRRGQILIIPLGKANQTGESTTIAPPKPPLKLGASSRPCPGCQRGHRVAFYRVKKGDSLYHISKKYNVEVASLVKLNRLQDRELKAGSRLRIPKQNTRLS